MSLPTDATCTGEVVLALALEIADVGSEIGPRLSPQRPTILSTRFGKHFMKMSINNELSERV